MKKNEKKSGSKQEVKKTNKIIIIVCVLLTVFLYIVPTIFFMCVAFTEIDSSDYELVGNEIKVGKDNFTINNLNTFYDSEDKAYVISGNIENLKYDLDYLTVVFEVYDADNYVLGEAHAYLDTLKVGTKYKFKATYYDYDAENAIGYKVKEISFY